MSDLIDRQVVLDRIKKQRKHLRPDLYPQDKIDDSAYRICAEFVERIPSAEPEPHWIPTSKEHPPKRKQIWITDVYGDVDLVYRGDGRLWLVNGDNRYVEDEIIAWMPANVPSPYQPEE